MPFFITTPMSRNSPSSAIRLNGVLLAHSASSAPTPAEGRVDSTVSGCSRFSYRMPSTMYTASNTPRMSQPCPSVLTSDFGRPSSPSMSAMTVAGMRSASSVWRTASSAWASVTPGATEKLISVAENWSTWRSRSRTMSKRQVASSASATCLPSEVMICTRSSASGFSVKRSDTSITTWYWLSSSYRVATCR